METLVCGKIITVVEQQTDAHVTLRKKQKKQQKNKKTKQKKKTIDNRENLRNKFTCTSIFTCVLDQNVKGKLTTAKPGVKVIQSCLKVNLIIPV